MMVTQGGRRIAFRDDEPSAIYTAQRLARREIPGSAGPGRETRAVVELSRAMGGMTMRALLGATFVPNAVKATTALEIGVGAPMGWGAPASCVSELGSPLVAGLPNEFADPVLEGFFTASTSSPLPSGTVHVDRAGFDEVDSSDMAFKLAAGLLHAVIAALAHEQDPLTAAQTTASAW